ncbi:hypothetical protein TSOC_008322, partial [Tetrabaena socialis]
MGRASFQMLKGCLLAVLFLGTLAFSGLAQSEPDPDAGVDQTLDGGDTAALGKFPFCQCQDYRCSTSPYRLMTVASPEGRTNELCFRVDRVGCSQANPCCKILLEMLGKIEFAVDKTCKPEYIGSYINGARNNSFFDTDYDVGKIRITPLRFNVNTVTNATICLRFQPGAACASYPRLCSNPDGVCTYATPKCDCISSFIQTTSRFRLEYARSLTTADAVTYQFNLYVERPQDCWSPGYRNGSCCNQTLVNIGLSLADSIALESLGDATLTTDKGLVMRVSKLRTFWGVQLYPNDLTQGRFYEPSLYVTNFTAGKPWTLSVPVALDASPAPRPGLWPCKASRYLPNDPLVCDIQLNGYQTVTGKPTTILSLDDYEVPNCCPEGLLRFGKEDTCCVDNLAENPYRMSYNATVKPTRNDTVFSFKLSYAGISNGPFGGALDGRTNCSVSEVDQVTLFVEPAYLNFVYRTTVDGVDVDFTRSKNAWQSWVRLINLNKVTQTLSTVSVFLSADVRADQLCTAKVAESPLCEYVLKGSYDDAAKEFMCCPRGATAVSAATCPA